MSAREIVYRIVDIDSVKTHPKNVRQGDIGAISESLKTHGQYRPIVVDERTKLILAGNHTWKAAKALGWSEINAGFIETKDDDEALRILLTDNRTTDLASYDDEELAELLKQLSETDIGLEGTAFDGDDLDSLLKDLGHFEIPTDVDEIPENVPAISKLGDVWLLGEHRVMCGDSTKQENVDRLMFEKKAVLFHTDPPYGVSYKGGRKKWETLKNDGESGDQLVQFLLDAFICAQSVCVDDASWYVWHASNTTAEFYFALKHLQKKPSAQIIWVKNVMSGGFGDYRGRHEPAVYCSGGRSRWNAGRDQDTVWNVSREPNYQHPTQKPVELVSRALKNSSKEKDLVLDLFGGSGSTLIAAQETNRIAYLMELDPHYVDVICARYQKHTGNQPILEATGEPHDFNADL